MIIRRISSVHSENNNNEFDMGLKCCYIFLLLFYSYSIKAGSESDTLMIAKSLIQKNKFKKAERMLSAFEQAHPNDLNTVWLYGQTAYWNSHYKTFRMVYKKAMNRFPSNYYLKLDYALKLVDCGDVADAAPFLEMYKKYDPSSNAVKITQAKIAYWQGDYQLALQLLRNEALLKEKKQEADALKEEILAAESPWLKLGVDYLKDDQPLKTVTPFLEAGMHVHAFLNPEFSFGNTLFKTDSASLAGQRFVVGNKFNFFKTGLTAVINGGFNQLPNKEKTGTGSVEITKKSFKYLQLSVVAALQPYLVTLSSISSTVVPYHFAISGGWNNMNSWNGKTAASMDVFPKDQNRIYNIGAWIFAPPLKLSSFRIRLGYAYGYSNAKENRYVAKESLAAIVSAYPKTTMITGVYDPYFTPAQQQVHSALLNLMWTPHKRLELGANTSIAFAGHTDDPYLFLDKNKNNLLFVNKDYSTVSFYPDKVDAYVLYKITKNASIKMNYAFLKNNFYTCHSAGLSLVINFWNGQNKK